jgi:cysteine synthase A
MPGPIRAFKMVAMYQSLLGCIGNTPMLRLSVTYDDGAYCFYGKLEFLNPSGSIKDRIAGYIVEQAEHRGLLKPGYTIVEATSGNTGIALSMVAAAKGYRMLVVMPEHMTGERIKIMANLGAEICLTPREQGFEGAVARADKIAKDGSGYFLANQFRNPDNVMAHYHTTGQEIIDQMGGQVDSFVAGVGTGGTLMGVAKALREKNPDVLIVAVEPEESAILSGCKDLRDHKIAGIGDGFVPEIVKMELVNQVVTVKSDDSLEMARRLSRERGLPVGISSGANVLASIRIMDKIGKEKRVVTVLPDRTERYFSTDLYTQAERQVWQCSKYCECRFRLS